MLKIIFIDARKKEISILRLEGNVLSECQRLVEGYIQSVYNIDEGNEIYADEDGLMKNYRYGFSLLHNPAQIYVGNGIVMRHNKEGEEIDTNVSVKMLKMVVRFHEIQG